MFLPDRGNHPEITQESTPVIIDGEEYNADFKKVAVNVIRRSGSETNELKEILQRWFGQDAGLPGTNFRVVFKLTDEGYTLVPYRHLNNGVKTTENKYFNKIVEFINGLQGIENIGRSSMVGFYSMSKMKEKKLALVWLAYPRKSEGAFNVHLRKETDDYKYPEALLKNLPHPG